MLRPIDGDGTCSTSTGSPSLEYAPATGDAHTSAGSRRHAKRATTHRRVVVWLKVPGTVGIPSLGVRVPRKVSTGADDSAPPTLAVTTSLSTCFTIAA
jgi:hypothetical protein